ncbi:MAG: hypothetical protein ORO03_09740 [Alphaproteobacteria bacterium]|nr:hypothetical protein [Alphaproteobacteria bacterium]
MDDNQTAPRTSAAARTRVETPEAYALSLMENGQWQVVERYPGHEREAALTAAREASQAPNAEAVRLTASFFDSSQGVIIEKTVFREDKRNTQGKTAPPGSSLSTHGAESLDSPFSTGSRASVLAPRIGFKGSRGRALHLPKFLFPSDPDAPSQSNRANPARRSLEGGFILPTNSWMSAILALIAGVSTALLIGYFPEVTALVLERLGTQAIPLLAIFAFLSGAGFIALFIQSTRREYRPPLASNDRLNFGSSRERRFPDARNPPHFELLRPSALDRPGVNSGGGDKWVKASDEFDLSTQEKLGTYRSAVALTLGNNYSSAVIKSANAAVIEAAGQDTRVEKILPGFHFDDRMTELAAIGLALVQHPSLASHPPLRTPGGAELTVPWQLICLGLVTHAFDNHPYDAAIAARLLVPILTNLGLNSPNLTRDEARRLSLRYDRYRDDRFHRAIMRGASDIFRSRASDPNYPSRIASLIEVALAGPNPVDSPDTTEALSKAARTEPESNRLQETPQDSITILICELALRDMRAKAIFAEDFVKQQQLGIIVSEVMKRFMGRQIPYQPNRYLFVFGHAVNGLGALISLRKELTQQEQQTTATLPLLRSGMSLSPTRGEGVSKRMTEAIATALELCHMAQPGECLTSTELAARIPSGSPFQLVEWLPAAADFPGQAVPVPKAFRLTMNE